MARCEHLRGALVHDSFMDMKHNRFRRLFQDRDGVEYGSSEASKTWQGGSLTTKRRKSEVLREGGI